MANYTVPDQTENEKGREVYDVKVAKRDQSGNPSAYFIQDSPGKQFVYAGAPGVTRLRNANKSLFDNAPDVSDAEFQDMLKGARKTKTSTGPAAGDPPPEGAPEPTPEPSAEETIMNMGMPEAPQFATTTTSSGVKSRQTTRTEQDEELVRKYDEAQGILYDSINARAKLEKNALDEQAAAHENMYLEKTRQNQELQADLAEKQGRYNEMMESAQKFQKSVREMKVNPQRMWQDMSDGRKVTAAVSILLGGLGQAMTGAKSNAAWDIIDKAVERDVQAQMENIQNARLAGQDMVAAAQEFRQMFRNEADLKRALMATQFDAMADQLESKRLATQGTLVEQNTQVTINEMRARAAKEREELGRRAITESQQTQWSSKKVPIMTGGKGKQLSEGGVRDLNKRKTTLENFMKVRESFVNGRADQGLVGKVKEWILSSDNAGAKALRAALPMGEADVEAYLRQNMALVRYVNTMSGQSMTEQEFQRYTGFSPRLGTDPETNKALINTFMDNLTADYTNEVLGLRASGYDVSSFYDPGQFSRKSDENKNQKLGFTKEPL